MLKKTILMIGLALCASLPATTAEEAVIKVDKKNPSKMFVQLISTSKFAEAMNMCDARMSAAMSAAQLQQVWQQLLDQIGALQSFEETRTEAASSQYKITVFAGKFERGQKDILVTWDENGKIAGFFLKEHLASIPEPPYAKKDLFTETPVIVGQGAFQLQGTLSLPKGKGPFPALVLVHGSGAHDRDETVAGVKPFRDIAFGLASNGIAVLRYEKRNYKHAKEMIGQLSTMTVKEEVIDDALEAVKILKKQSQINPDKIFVLGHSLGGYVIPRIANSDPSLAGIISMAGSTRPMEEMCVEQLKYLESLKIVTQQHVDKAIEDEKLIKDPAFYSSNKTVLGAPASYWKDLQGYDPPALAAGLKLPIFIIQGESDYQVTMKGDYSRWKTALGNHPNVSFKSYPGLGHLFTNAGNPPSPLDYDQAGNVDAAVVKDIAAWIKANS